MTEQEAWRLAMSAFRDQWTGADELADLLKHREALLVLLGGMKVGEEDAGDWTLGPDDWVVSSRGF